MGPIIDDQSEIKEDDPPETAPEGAQPFSKPGDRWKTRFENHLCNEVIRPNIYSWFDQWVVPSKGFAVSQQTRSAIDSRKLNFKQDIDVRGMRGDEALNAVMYFIDDAILVGMSRVRILHGTGTGALRQIIRQYLASVPNVKSFRDEHVQFGGAGITVVELE